MAADLNKMLEQETLYQVDLEEAVQVEEETTIKVVIDHMREQNRTVAVITKNDRLVGIFTQRDVLKKLALTGLDLSLPISKVMTRSPDTVGIKVTLKKVIDMFTKGHYRSVPVMDKDLRVAGIVTTKVLVQHIAEHFPEEIYNLPDNHRQVAIKQDGA